MDWSQYPNFTESEMRCKHTGKCEMHPVFMQRLQHLRTVYGAPLIVNSAYRDKSHPEEVNKTEPGAHTMGRAVDLSIRGADAVKLLRLALEFGFTGIGISQKGASRFIHLDDVADGSLPRPSLWSY